MPVLFLRVNIHAGPLTCSPLINTDLSLQRQLLARSGRGVEVRDYIELRPDVQYVVAVQYALMLPRVDGSTSDAYNQ